MRYGGGCINDTIIHLATSAMPFGGVGESGMGGYHGRFGFDTFTPIEYMEHIEMTPLGWAKDSVLTEEIEKVLDSTEEADFIYTISVQGHGAYPETAVLEDPEIEIEITQQDSKETYSEEEYYGILYYVNQLHEMDDFLKQLTDMLAEREEPVVLVLYGDHLPGFSFTEEDLKNRSLFQTQYVMWSNFDMEQEYKDLEAYQLYSYVLDRLGMGDGLLMKLHQKFLKAEISEEDYLENLKVLEYDMLYGDLDCYGGENPHEPTNLVLGVSPIEIDSVTTHTDAEGNVTLLVNGQNFTAFSRIFVNDEELETVSIDSAFLTAEYSELQEGDIITVRQVGKDGSVVGTTEEYVYQE